MNHLRVLGLLFFFSVCYLYAGGRQEQLPPPVTNGSEIFSAEEANNTESRGEIVFRALAAAYPDRINAVEFYDDDWTIVVYGERFFFAEGRVLPAAHRNRTDYAPLPFYNYHKELPPWNPPTAEEAARLREVVRLRQTGQQVRSTYFSDALWRTRNADEAWENVKQIRFLGHSVMVHYSILVHLSLVEQEILRAARTNNAVRQWINNISSVGGWHWRNIAASENRSFHAYGAAIDTVSRSPGETYWLWTSRHTADWWNVPYSRRHHPPEEVVKIFESFGFIWGGKWVFYDSIHFEYRPEILILNGMPPMDFRELR